jgi:hypothetical protein
MKVKRGWATDFGKIRFDVEVDETDLLRMLTEHGAADPRAVAARMDTFDVFRIMDAEAEAWASLSLSKQEPAQADVHRARVKAQRTERDRLLAKYVSGKQSAPAG